MMTGRHISDIKVYGNGVGLAAVDGKKDQIDPTCLKSDFTHGECQMLAKTQKNDGTFIDVLADAGYSINLFGKLHVGAGLARFVPNIGDIMSLSSFGGVSGPDQKNFVKEWTRATGITNHVLKSPEHAPMLGSILRSTSDHDTPYRHTDAMTSSRCAKMIQQGLFAQETPQFLYCSFEVPHPELKTNQTYWDRINMGKHALPVWPKKESMHPADIYTSMMKGSWQADSAPTEEIETARHVYFSMCEEADDLIGEVLKAVETSGATDNTYIIFVSDHGEHAYENFAHGKESLKEASARVPFMLAGPGVKAQGLTMPASLHDIYPTIIDIAGAKARRGPLAGESLLSIAHGTSHGRKQDYVIAQYHARDSGTGEFMIVQNNLKLIAYGGPQIDQEQWPSQLFNLAKDPHEFNDLAKTQSAVVKKMEALLRNQLNIEAIDKEKKQFDKDMFLRYFYPIGGASKCVQSFSKIFVGFNETDAAKVSKWCGKPCDGQKGPHAWTPGDISSAITSNEGAWAWKKKGTQMKSKNTTDEAQAWGKGAGAGQWQKNPNGKGGQWEANDK